MANISVRKENDQKAPLAPTREPHWDPFRMMRELMNWDPFREMAPFARQPVSTFVPAFEVKETKDAYLFKADLPGVKESDVEITMTGNRLQISGKRESEKEEKNDTYYTYERSYGDFTRAFTLPDGIDEGGVLADLKDGVLTVSVKKLPEAQPKKITIQTAAKKS
jgi:HSP20 family protein